jgi:uncharacterized integral membrane protein (TIGR00698 family)
MRRILPGLVTTALLAACAFVLATLPMAPFTLENGVHPLGPSSVAILLGILFANILSVRSSWVVGLRFSSRVILPIGIVLLGARLAFGDLMKVGLTGLLLSLLSIGTCALVVFTLTRWFSLPVKLATLVGVGTAICGGSAIAAAAPVIEADDEDISWSVATVALLGLVAMFVLPVAGHLLGVESSAFGVWAGLTIQQTPQVVAAGLAYGGEAGEVATLIKLVRVTLLAPAVFVLGLVYARSRAGRAGGRVRWTGLVPPFVLGFLAMAAMGSLGWLELSVPWPALGDSQWTLQDLARQGDRIALAIAMAAIGLETKLGSFRREGLKPLAVGLATAVAVSVVTFLAIRALGDIGA